MTEQLDVIRRALAPDATTEQREAAREACRAVLIALGGLPVSAPTAAPAPSQPRSAPDAGVVLDALIARLGPLAQAKQAAKAAQLAAPTVARPDVAPRAVAVHPAVRLNIPFVPVRQRGGGA